MESIRHPTFSAFTRNVEPEPSTAEGPVSPEIFIFLQRQRRTWTFKSPILMTLSSRPNQEPLCSSSNQQSTIRNLLLGDEQWWASLAQKPAVLTLKHQTFLLPTLKLYTYQVFNTEAFNSSILLLNMHQRPNMSSIALYRVNSISMHKWARSDSLEQTFNSWFQCHCCWVLLTVADLAYLTAVGLQSESKQDIRRF